MRKGLSWGRWYCCRSVLSQGRKRNRKRRALAFFAFNVNCRSVLLCDRLADGESESLPGSPFSLKALNLRRGVVGCNGMFVLLASLLLSLRGCLQTRAALHVENLALRHQLLLLQRVHQNRRLRLRSCDRLIWVWLSRVWSNWRSALRIVKPETVIAWHRQCFGNGRAELVMVDRRCRRKSKT